MALGLLLGYAMVQEGGVGSWCRCVDVVRKTSQRKSAEPKPDAFHFYQLQESMISIAMPRAAPNSSSAVIVCMIVSYKK